ncbi:MAG: YcgN family cysteine cluster protein, partial [Rhodobacteraceae bacterium]|nr:YcgN family cysteine cluster protein [Paracoccaceae bacterium]
LTALTPEEWEALCDGCGKCCLNKLEDEETGQVCFTRVACRLLDGESCRCGQYQSRKIFVPECVVLSPKTLADISYWLPSTCAYRLRADGNPLPDWHYLISGDPESVHATGQSVRGWTVPEFDIPEEEWEDHIIEDL